MTNFKLSVEGITKKYNEVTAVKSASFQVQEKSTLVIKGASGSGKTTLLRLIAGLELPDAGEIYINAKKASDLKGALSPHLRDMGFVFQSPALWPHLSVAGNILFGISDKPKEVRQARLKELLARVELEGYEKRFPDQLSGGQARRVALARTLAPEPPCLLMDEPLTNLDDQLKAEMLYLIKTEAARLKAALIYVTHDSAEAVELGGQIITMKDGCLSN